MKESPLMLSSGYRTDQTSDNAAYTSVVEKFEYSPVLFANGA